MSGIPREERRRTALDDSSPAEEQQRERKKEDDRRDAIERYNESTFGERRPIASAFLRIAAIVALAFLMHWFLPRNVARTLAAITIVAFAFWEIRRDGWRQRFGVHRPSRWW
jgi:hypothetical protein